MAQTKVSLIKEGVVTVDNLHTNHGITTDHISEGQTRQYFTSDRVQTFLTTNNYITNTDVSNLETVTSLSLSANILSYVDESGNTTNLDLSLYLDDSNLARLVSGTVNSETGIATFTRDDATSFSVDFSAFVGGIDDFVNTASFDTSTGILTLTRLGGGTVTVNLDDRYLTSYTETDPIYTASSWYTTTNNSSNWDTAYGWGDHSSAGYLTSYTETDTLATVTARGASTSTAVTIGAWNLRNYANQVEYLVLDNGNLNGLAFKVRYDGATANRWWDLGFKDGNGTYYEGLKGYNNSTLTWIGNTIWHAGNDGSGSGLDADLLDGQQGSYYQPASTAITTSNIGSQSVSYATNAGTLDGIDSSNFFRTDGTYPNTDMNTTVEGYWHVASGSANLPVNYYGHRWDYDHIQNGQWVFQMYSPTGGDVDLWFRQKRDHAATSWQKVITSGNIGSQSIKFSTTAGDNRFGNILVGEGTYKNTIVPIDDTNLNINTPSGAVYFNTYTIASGSHRAPIFYDSNDTGYYLDPSSNSRINTIYFDTLRNPDGNWILGQDNATTFSIGSSAVSDTMLINATYITQTSRVSLTDASYYIGSPSYGFRFNNNADSINSLIVNNSGDSIAHASMRAPVFFDSNNTAYYVDPDSTNISINVRGEIQNPSIWINDGDNYNNYNENIRLFNPANGVSVIGFGCSGTGGVPTSSILGYSDRHEVRIGSTWRTRLYGGYLEVNGDARATLFYDSNNTGYVIDPTSTSNISNLHLDGYIHVSRSNTTGNGIILADDGDIVDLNDAYCSMRFSSGVRVFSANRGGSAVHTLHSDGNAYFNTSARSPIFYDNNDTNYYVNPNGYTNLYDGNLELRREYGIDLRSLDSNTFYPITIGVPTSGVWLEVQVNLNTGTTPWSTHGSGFTLNVMWRTNGSGWGTTDIRRQVFQYHERFTNQTICGGIGQLYQSSREYIYLRGGGYYNLYSSRPISYDIVTTSTTYAQQSIAPITSPANNVWESFAGGYNDYSDYLYTIALYDRNDTSYYLDPHSTSRLYRVDSPTGYTSVGNPWSTGDSAFFPNGITTAGGQNWIYGNTFIGNAPSNGAGHQFFTSGSSESTGDMVAFGSMRAPIFYDYNDTNYYVDPASSSYLNVVNAGSVSGSDVYTTGGWFRNHTNNNGIYWSGTGWHLYPKNNSDFYIRSGNTSEVTLHFIRNDGTSWGYIHNDSNRNIGFLNYNRGWVSYTDVNGNHYATASSRAPIFYDSNNTSYYVNPDGTSYLLGLTVNGAIDNYGGINAYGGIFAVPNMTIDKTNTYGTGIDLTFSGSQSTGMLIRNNTGATTSAINFFYSSAPQGARGSITVSSTSTAYNTSSDYRLKENLVEITDGIERVKLLQPKRFNFIGDDKTVDGFVAHEAQEVVPEAVTGVKDGLDHEGNPEYQGIDQAKLVPLLTAALQEAIAKIEDLESRLQAIESQ